VKEIIYILFLVSAGAGEHPHAPEFKPIAELFRIINFLVVSGVLYFVLSKYVRIFFTGRREIILQNLNEAEQFKISADKRLSEWESKVRDIQMTISQMMEDAKKESEFIQNGIIKSAHETSRRIVEKAKEEIDFETKKSKENLKKWALKIATKMAEDILKKKITKEDNTTLIRNYLNDSAVNELQNLSEGNGGTRGLKNIFSNRSIAMQLDEDMLSQLINRLKPEPAVKDLLSLILKKNRIKYLNKIFFTLEDLTDQIQNKARIKVKTAFRLGENEVAMLKKRFIEITKSDVILDIQEDPELIGGIVAQFKGTVLDGSIKNQLRSFGDRRW
jgi:F-type H+-transporting ATPase subunit b